MVMAMATAMVLHEIPIASPSDRCSTSIDSAMLTASSLTDYYLHGGMDHDTALKRIKTAGSISISPELFEKIYLSPQNQVKGELRKTFANPTPL